MLRQSVELQNPSRRTGFDSLLSPSFLFLESCLLLSTVLNSAPIMGFLRHFYLSDSDSGSGSCVLVYCFPFVVVLLGSCWMTPVVRSAPWWW